MHTLAGNFILFFFFSSRRRHTRYIGDWSSDVCSSDLWPSCTSTFARSFFQGTLLKDRANVLVQLGQVQAARVMKFTSVKERSEERRVGKECRTQGAT